MKKLFFLLALTSVIYSQSYHTITTNDGVNDFNTQNERFNTTRQQIYSYITWDKDYIYFGYSGSTPGGSITDNDRVFHIYIDSDPNQDPMEGEGTTDGEQWRWDPVLPFTANYHYAFKTVNNEEIRKVYSNNAWVNSDFGTQNYKATNYWELRISRSGLGNPYQINVLAYIEEDWNSTASITGGVPFNLFTDNTNQGLVNFNNHWVNLLLIDQIYPNNAFNKDNIQWSLRLKASVNSLSDTATYAGMAVNATDGFDSGIDLAKPPTPPSNYVEVFFPHSDWNETVLGPKFSRDFKRKVLLDSTTSSWDFSVVTSVENGSVTITADNFSFIPANYGIRIYDITADSTHDVRNSGTYQYTSGAAESERQFTLIIGTTFSDQNISVSANNLNFGTVKTDSDSTINLTLRNTGQLPLTISGLSSSNQAFTYTANLPAVLEQNQQLVVPVTFTPLAAAVYSGTLSVTSDDPDTPLLNVSLTGTGQTLSPDISSSTRTLAFGGVRVDYSSTLSFKIYNNGDTTLAVSSIYVAGSAFTYTGNTSFNVNVNDSATISLIFEPLAVTLYQGTVGIVSNDPDTDTLTVQLSGEGVTSTVAKVYPAGWSMVSVPVIPDNGLASVVFGDDFSSWFLYNYSGTGGYFSADTVKPGRGYWLGIETSDTLDVTGTPITDSLAYTLNAGWNMVSSPFLRKYLASEAFFSKDGELKTAAAAASAGWIQNVYHYYQTSPGSYAQKDTLEQWNSYWLTTLTSGVDIVFYHSSSVGTPLKNGSPFKLDLNNWIVSITAEMNGKTDKLLGFGVRTEASDGFDALYDYAKPPIAPAAGAFETYFLKTDWSEYITKFAADIRVPYNLPEPGKSWDFNFRSRAQGTVTLRWENILEQIPQAIRDNYYFMLEGEGLQGSINMLSQSSHSFNAAANAVYSFRINSSLTGIGDGGEKDFSFRLGQNYPNPFNPSTIISYELNSVSYVTLKVYDFLGKEVAVLIDSEKSAGNHTVSFSAETLASGIYFYTIEARGSDGSFRKDVKKMMLLR